MKRISSLAVVVLGCLLWGCADDLAADGPAEPLYRPGAAYTSLPIPPAGAVPSPQQAAWGDMEVNALVAYGVNTFTDREWGTGRESPNVFAPSALDAAQWVEAAKAGGIQGILLTAKHHDGFALWPSAQTDHSVARSPWRGGRGDLVRELADATRAAGLQFGVYLSPWDMHEPAFGTPAYDGFYRAQQRELIGRSSGTAGSIFEFWMDGAFGDDVPPSVRNGLDWRGYSDLVHSEQSDALVAFSRDIDWAGTEAGRAPDTYWNDRDGIWTPIECDMAFRQGWYWHPSENPKSVNEMVDVYFRTVGRGCVLLLGLAPDRRGLMEDEDVRRLAGWKRRLDRIFETNWAAYAPATASSTRAGADGWAPGAATDGDRASFWAADAASAWLEVDLGAPRRVSVVEVAEPVRYGQRVEAYHVEAFVGGGWVPAARGTTVGRRRLDRIRPITAQRWRLVIDGARADAAVSTFALYRGIP